MAVFATGMLGVGLMQSKGIRVSMDGEYLGQAAYLAANMADRMRANPDGVTQGHYASIKGDETNPDCLKSGCTASQLAQYDAFSWQSEIGKVLPAGASGTITSAQPFAVHTLTITWTESTESLDADAEQQYVIEVTL